MCIRPAATILCRLFPAHHPLEVDIEAVMPTHKQLDTLGKPESPTLQSKGLLQGQNPVNDHANASGLAATKSALNALMKEHACEASKWDVWAEDEDEELHEEGEMQVGCLSPQHHYCMFIATASQLH